MPRTHLRNNGLYNRADEIFNSLGQFLMAVDRNPPLVSAITVLRNPPRIASRFERGTFAEPGPLRLARPATETK
jgi:hypothetical protein